MDRHKVDITSDSAIGGKTRGSKSSKTEAVPLRGPTKAAESATSDWAVIFDAVADLVSVHDKDFRFMKVNKALADFLKIKPDNLIGRKCYEIIHGAKEPPKNCPHRISMITGKPYQKEFFEPHLGLHLNISCLPFEDDNKALVGSVHILKNNTEFNNATLCSGLIEKLDELVYCAIVETMEPVYVNNAVKNVTGYTFDESIKKQISWTDIIHPDDKERFFRKAAELQKKPKNDSLEYRIIRRDKQVRWVLDRCYSQEDWNGKVTTLNGVVYDITERKKVEDALRESEEKVRSIFRATPTGIGLVSNRILVEVNDRICEITGYSKEELIGKDIKFLYASDKDYESVGREKYKQIKERGTGTVETRLRRKDGTIIDILTSSAALDPNDLSCGVTFTILDITGRKKAEKKLKKHLAFERAMSGFTAELLEGDDFHEVLEKAFRHIIEKSNFDRVWLTKDTPDWKRSDMQVIAEVYNDNFKPLIKKPVWLTSTFDSCFRKWREKLEKGDIVNLSYDHLSGLERQMAKIYGVKSALMIPVNADDNHYGHLGMASVSKRVISTAEEQYIIMAVAKIVEVYLSRSAAMSRSLNYQRKLREMVVKMQVTEKAERACIAAGLHDEIAQLLAFMKIKVDKLKKSIIDRKAMSQLTNMSKILTDVYDKLHHLIFDLNNPILDKFGIKAAVEDLLGKTTSDYNIKTKVNCVEPNKRLDNKQENFLFKAVKELIANTIKYAQAKNISVSIENRDENIIVSVADDGVGFETSDEEKLGFDRSHGFGLFIIKEQLETFGGSIKVESEKGDGTTVSITMPIMKE